jgi:hypothetical protein
MHLAHVSCANMNRVFVQITSWGEMHAEARQVRP